MTITPNNYHQFHDYLFQLTNLPGCGNVPKIIPKEVAARLNVDKSGSSVRKFLNHITKEPKTMLINFIVKYPIEFHQWPLGKTTIERVLQISDAMYFLGIPALQQQINIVPGPIIQTPQPLMALPMPTQMGASLNTKPLVPVSVNPNVNTVSTPPAPPPVTMRLALVAGNLPPLPVPKVRVLPIILPQQGQVHTLPQMIFVATNVNQSVIVGQSLPGRPRPVINRTPIAISYRGHQTAKDGDGMLFDHMRIQTLTGFPTATLLPENQQVAIATNNFFHDCISHHAAQLDFGVVQADFRLYPPTTSNCAELGLLIIPGRIQKIENEPIRLAHEYKVIRGALNRGQPILGLCAGVWRIWEQLYTWTRDPGNLNLSPIPSSLWHNHNQTTVEVDDHSFRGGMVRLDVYGREACNNAQIHDIIVEQGSTLHHAMKMRAGNNVTTVNSVHGRAVNANRSPLNTRVCVFSRTNPQIKYPIGPNARLMVPEACAEAFENNFGAPIIGTQWHPEAYNFNDMNRKDAQKKNLLDCRLHINLINYMAKAGDAYAAKRAMLRELPSRVRLIN